MDEIWEKAVETALVGETEPLAARVLTLDGAVKCVKGHLPRPEILEKFQNLEHLSIASIGVSSLDQFPRLGKLQKLVLSDNRISGGLEFLVQAGLSYLRDLDLSNNRIHSIEDLVPLAQLKLVSLDLYECPVTRLKDYRSKVFGLVKSLKYLDKMDAEENERPESEDEDDDEEEEEDDVEDEDDPGSCEIDAEERPNVMSNGHTEMLEGVVEVDEEESEADEEDADTGRQSNGVGDHANGLRDEHLNVDNEENDDSDEEDEYEEDVGEGDSDEEVDNVEEGHLRVPPGNRLQRDINGEFDGDEGVAEAVRLSNGTSDLAANGSQDVLLNVDDEENDYSDEEEGEDEYEEGDDGFLVGDTEDSDLGGPHRSEIQRNIVNGEFDGHELDEDDGESGEEEEVDNEEGHVSVRDINGEFDGDEGVAEMVRLSNRTNGSQNVLLNVDDEENDDSDEEEGEDEYEEDDGYLVVDNDVSAPHRNDLLRNIIIGEIDGHELEEDDDGESGEEEAEEEEEEEEQGVEDGEGEDEECGAGQPEAEAIEVDEEVEGEEECEDDEVQVVYSIASSNHKRKRDEDDDGNSGSSSSDDDDDDDDGSSDDDGNE